MAVKWKSLGLLLRIAVKYFVRWLIREMLDELKEGIYLRVVLDGEVYWLLIQLQPSHSRASPGTVIDVGKI